MILVAGLLAVASVVMNPSPPSGQGEPEKTLQDASATRLKSMTSGDAEGWGKYTTDDFIVIEADGGVKTKAQRMTEIKGTTTPPTGANTALANQKWRMYGPNTAISTQQTPVDGKPTWITTVWVKQQGAWKVATVQMTNIAK